MTLGKPRVIPKPNHFARSSVPQAVAVAREALASLPESTAVARETGGPSSILDSVREAYRARAADEWKQGVDKRPTPNEAWIAGEGPPRNVRFDPSPVPGSVQHRTWSPTARSSRVIGVDRAGAAFRRRVSDGDRPPPQEIWRASENLPGWLDPFGMSRPEGVSKKGPSPHAEFV